MKHLELQTEAYRVIHREFARYVSACGFAETAESYVPAAVCEFLFEMEKKTKRSLRNIQPQDVWNHYQYITQRANVRREGGLSATTIGHHVYSLRLFFSWLEQLEAISVNPMTGLEFPKLYSPRRTALSLDHIKQLYSITETQLDRVLLGIYYGCGLRRSEGAALNLRDVVWSSAKVIVRHGKFNKRREVPLHTSILKDLRKYYEQERIERLWPDRPTQAFMVNVRSERLEGKRANVRIQQLAEKAGIEQEVTLHVLRHSIATHLLDKGMSLEQIRQFLGHSSLDVTERYVLGSQKSWRKRESVYTKNRRKIYQAS